MPGSEDWIVEEDGLPPSNSSLAESDRYDTFGNPVTCCETVEVKSPAMGEQDVTGGLVILGVVLIVILIMLSFWRK